MKQYIWFHPSYLIETTQRIIDGQTKNAQKNGYIVLTQNELHKVGAEDHLTLVGHSTAPNELGDDQDTGLYIQTETAEQCVNRLKRAGLKQAPKILSLECCNAGIPNGIGMQLAAHPFFYYTLIETNLSAIGRNPGTILWNMPIDRYGRVVTDDKNKSWIFLHNGQVIDKKLHGTYELQDIIPKIEHFDFHSRFFAHYKPGFLGGRAGRHCFFTGDKITPEKARFFASLEPESATVKALEEIDQEDLQRLEEINLQIGLSESSSLT